MKTILVPTEQHDLMDATLDTALLLARKFESYIEGFALRSAIADVVAMDIGSSMAMATLEQHDAEAAGQARAKFEAFMQSRGVPRLEGTRGALSFGWSEAAPYGDDFVGSYGRVFDVTVLGRPGDVSKAPRMITVEAALFDSGRPVLIAPPAARQTIGETILLDWNCSTEQSRSTAFAMPLLRQAKRVVVLTVEGGTVPGPSGEQLARSLMLNGIPTEHRTVASDRRNRGEEILAQAEALGCDLLIKGAYTQSRLRQMIFGGATRHILAATNVPVLMAH